MRDSNDTLRLQYRLNLTPLISYVLYSDDCLFDPIVFFVEFVRVPGMGWAVAIVVQLTLIPVIFVLFHSFPPGFK